MFIFALAYLFICASSSSLHAAACADRAITLENRGNCLENFKALTLSNKIALATVENVFFDASEVHNAVSSYPDGDEELLKDIAPANTQTQKPSIAYLWGPAGVGKTHLLTATQVTLQESKQNTLL